MPDPQKHADSRGWIESIAQWIPGFHGYLEREYRRDSDQLARQWMADRLSRSKKSLAAYVNHLVESGRLEELTPCRSFATRLDTMIGKFQSAPVGYSGFFDFVKIGESELEKIYHVDVSLFSLVDGLVKSIDAIVGQDESPTVLLKPINLQLSEIEQVFYNRKDILLGLSDR